MAAEKSGDRSFTDEELQDLVASTDSGARNPIGPIGRALAGIALLWSLFQLWIGGPLQFIAGITFNSTEARSIHLAFAVFLAFMAYPAFARSPRDRIPVLDWIFALAGAFCAGYGYLFYATLAETGAQGDPTQLQLYIAAAGLILLLEAARRSLGPALAIVAMVFLAYVFFGSSDVVPDVIRWKGASFTKTMSHMWLTTEGVFGIALGVSTSFVFLFVLFGSLLDKAGAGNYLIKLAFALLGHLRGGPAKAAVVGSAMTGLISGSSIANVVTTGTFTIPLMKRVGFTNEQAGSVEVASSVNGQLMPPVMGAAAFLMVEYTNTPYLKVMQYAILPALISYIALVYIVHLEALKNNTKTLGEGSDISFAQMLVSGLVSLGGSLGLAYVLGAYVAPALGGGNFISLIVMAAGTALLLLATMWSRGVPANGPLGWLISTGSLAIGMLATFFISFYFFIRFLQDVFGGAGTGIDLSTLVIVALIGLAYVFLLRIAAGEPDLEADDPNAEVVKLPVFGEVVRTGLYYFLPIILLVWFLMVEQKSPKLSAFWAAVLLIVMLLTQKPLKAFFRGQADMIGARFREGFDDLIDGLITGARNMIGIGVATATAGIIVGTVTLTGIGQVMADLVEFLSFGSLPLMLVWVGILSLILGMGLPTTANYIVVSSLMAGVIVSLGAENGLIVPLIAAHLFVFYFGIMADVTPPVGLASFAAAAVSGGDPLRTGFTAFFYSLRTVALPFLFIFNTDLILYDVTWQKGVLVFIVATFAMLLFAAATQGYFFARSKIYESIALLLVAFTLFRPGFWLDYVQAPYETVGPAEIVSAVDAAKPGSDIRLTVTGPDFDTGEMKELTLVLPVEGEGDGESRLADAGLTVLMEDNKAKLEEPFVGTTFSEKLGTFDFYADDPVEIVQAAKAAERMPKEIFYIPALLLLALVIVLQRRRQTQPAF
ncbi:TRAP transporter permease [Salaquimonas pukyongi]|uniref:TRAP transporter permease n=1 Tax=Salaquimonas pukyongi TaxID=2712698 RepID=UPI00096B8D83|nr:TRAP transporter permease [Salaquimonas pukyongi]